MTRGYWIVQSDISDVERHAQYVKAPDYASDVGCYQDPEYESAHQLRVGAASGDVVIVEGYDGPQPAPPAS